MAVAAPAKVTVNLEAACLSAQCARMSEKMRRQLDIPNYTDGVSILEVPPTLEDWRGRHRTARKRADRAGRLGYTFAEIDRSMFNDDIYAINTSKQARQGRPMSAGYLERHNYGKLPWYACERHRVHTYGVLTMRPLTAPYGYTLVAYLNLYRLGELAMVSMILGHGDHLQNDIMYLLFAGVVADQTKHGGWFYYNRHDSGTEGLRYYKERLGFKATDIAWQM